MKKILLVFGTRPEAIKMAPVVHCLQKETGIETIVCVTAQHREMLDQVLNLFQIKPDFDLNLMKKGQDLYDITSDVLLGMREVLKQVNPDLVLVHGDTTTSMATSLASFYMQIPVGHVEAGLRTYNIYSPWPEEMNRTVTSRIAKFNFCPTQLNKDNLINEGVKEESIFITGNTVIDSLKSVVEKLNENIELRTSTELLLLEKGYDANRTKSRKLVLITGHRRENFGVGLMNICNSIKILSEKYPEIDFVYPMHLNPNVRKPIEDVFGNTKTENVFFIEPLDYLPFVHLMNLSTLILTDSGGIQEEAPGLKKPVLVMRDTTERPEALSAGTVKLVGTNTNTIVEEVSTLLDKEESYNNMINSINPYGEGNASIKIVSEIKKSLNII